MRDDDHHHDIHAPTAEQDAATQAMLNEHLVDMGVSAEAIAAVVAFADALTGRDAARMTSLLASTSPAAVDRAAYAKRLAPVLAAAPERTWRGEVFPDPMGGGEVLMAHVRADDRRGIGPSIQVALRLEHGAWMIDADVLDPRYVARIDMDEWMDPLKMFGLPESGELGYRPFARAGWEGPRALGGAVGPGQGREWIALLHGSLDSGPSVTVETSPTATDHAGGVHILAQAALPPTGAGTSHREARLGMEAADVLALSIRRSEMIDLELQVAGAPQRFRGWRTDHGFHVSAAIDDVFVSVTSVGTDESEIKLERVDSVTPYALGMIEEWRRVAAEQPPGEVSPRAIQVAMNMNAPDAEHDLLDFALDTFHRLAKMTPAGLAAISSNRVLDAHGGFDGYAEALATLLGERPITCSQWSSQPRLMGPATGSCIVELLFAEENPFLRWTQVDLVIEHGHAKLDTDLVELSSRSSSAGGAATA